MRRGRTVAFLLALAMLALPATSFAQNAGDDQYSDPLAGQGGGSSNGGGSAGGGSAGSSGSSGGGGSGSSVTPTSPTSSTPATAAGTGSSPQATAAGGGQGELPRTGFDVIVTIELGLAMLLAGIVAQRLLVLRDRRDL